MNPTVSPVRGDDVSGPTRVEIDRVAGELVLEFGSVILEDAIRYSKNRADAEDAYQRSLEILLTKAPSANREELLPWLRTVVKREALAISKSRPNEQLGLAPEAMEQPDSSRLSPDAVAESMADLAIGAEALERLTLDQVRCLVAQSKGLTYEEICVETGFSRRKVTRCIERGRRAFAVKLDAISTGSECERMQPLIHRLLASDPEAALELRPHLRHCVACRARIRAYESAPRNVAALFPPAVLALGAGTRGVIGCVSDWFGALEDRLVVHLIGVHRWAPLTPAKRAVAVVAAASLATSGGIAVHSLGQQSRESSRTQASARAAAAPGNWGMLDSVSVPAVREPKRHKNRRGPKSKQRPARAPAQNDAPASAAPSSKPAHVDDGSAEFAPESGGTE